MISLQGSRMRLCDGIERREMLRIGGLSMAGLSLAHLLAPSTSAAGAAKGKSFGKAKNCIILYLSGGPSHHDTFDPKPDAPAEIRGEFGLIDSALVGVPISEHLPRAARRLDKIAVVRSMTHASGGHAVGGYIMFTGHVYPRTPSEANYMGRNEAPHLGAALAKLSPGKGPFPFVLVPRRLDAGSGRRAGQWGGALGSKYDPLQTGGNPNDDDFRLGHLPLIANAPVNVLKRRSRLVDQLNRQVDYLGKTSLAKTIGANRKKALEVISSDAVRRAVDLASEDPKVRARYGRNLFGQSVLLGRRLLEAGTRLVSVNWLRPQGKKGYAWDSHRENFEALREDLIPPFDQSYSALLDDLAETGQLDETLVVVAGEFGRTPKVNKSAGRDHWPHVFTVLLAGAGIRGGQIYGASDKIGGHPADLPVSPGDLTATIYHCLGVDPHTELRDQLDRPFVLSVGDPVGALLA